MPRLPLHPSSGTGRISSFAKRIRFVRYGCTNRPFYHIVVMDTRKEQRKPPIEQLGSFDPCQNMYNEKLVAFNYERIKYWIGKGASLSTSVATLLGLCGFLPIHPRTYISAWRCRRHTEANDTIDATDATKATEATGRQIHT